MRAWVQSSLDSLGVQLQLPIPEDRRGAGITIAGTRPGSPAQKGGFRAGDMIASFGGTPVTTPLDLASLIAAAKPGTRYPIGVQRGGKSVTLQVSGVAPSKLARPTMPSMPAGPTLQPGR
jgi:serine protease Do